MHLSARTVCIARAQCIVKCTYSVHWSCSVHRWDHLEWTMPFHGNPFECTNCVQCTFNMDRSVHVQRALHVNCALLSALIVYNERALCTDECPYNVHFSCRMHYMVHVQFVLSNRGTCKSIYNVQSTCAVHWNCALPIHSGLVSALTSCSTRELCIFECTYSVHCTCTMTLWMYIERTVHMHRSSVCALTLYIASTPCPFHGTHSVHCKWSAHKEVH